MDVGRARVRLLLVDDNEEFLRAESAWLRSQPDFEVVATARSGETALDAVSQLHPDIVLMDLAMPGMGGFEAIRALKLLSSPPAVIAVSLHDSQVVRSEAAMAGADGFVPKARLSTLLVPALRGVHGAAGRAARDASEGERPASVEPQGKQPPVEARENALPIPGSRSGHPDRDAGAWSRFLAAVAARWSRGAWIRAGRAATRGGTADRWQPRSAG